jgi:hypothetical protein
VPVLVTGRRDVSEWARPVSGAPTTFKTANVGKPGDVTFSPFYRTHHRRYSVYWDLFTPEQWSAREADYRAEQERVRRLEAMTVDFAQPGEMQPERDHNMRGERTEASDVPGTKWRHATGGGWFSYDMKVSPDRPVSLVCTYWGSDSGKRTFDVLVDGEVLATQTLANNKPGQFFDVTYPIPASLTRGKEKVTVRFQAHPENTAGGVFGIRMVAGSR